MSDKPKTVRVRIAVAVDGYGCWEASKWEDNDRCNTHEVLEAMGFTRGQRVVHFIEADVPLPEPQTIEGEVT